MSISFTSMKIMVQTFQIYLVDPGEASGCSTNSLVISSLIQSLSQPFPPTALRHRHAQTVRDSSSSIFFCSTLFSYLYIDVHSSVANGRLGQIFITSIQISLIIFLFLILGFQKCIASICL